MIFRQVSSPAMQRNVFMKSTLSLQFIVREDLPSERSADYRYLIIQSLLLMRADHGTTCQQHLMIDRILNDHNEGHVLMAVEQRREMNAAIHKAADSESPDHELIRNLEAIVSKLDEIIGD
jgi:hypothetical protein